MKTHSRPRKKEPVSVLAIDPGPGQSAFVEWDGASILGKRIAKNDDVLQYLRRNKLSGYGTPPILVIERIKSYGMTVADDIFETVFWSGRFFEVWALHRRYRIPRMDVKVHICHDSRARDSNIRQALIDRFGKPGIKKNPGVTYGLKKDMWQAFALAVTAWDLLREGKLVDAK